LCCLAVGLGAGWAAEERPLEFRNLLIGFAGSPTPDVTEDSKDASGTTTSYDWSGKRSMGYQVSALVLQGEGGEDGGWEFGGGIAVANYDITPGSFVVAGSSYNNASSSTLHYRTLGLNVLGGYEYGLIDIDDFRGFVEVTPILGAGVAWADNEIHSATGGYDKKTGVGAYFEYGLRVGAYITESRWIYGINAFYMGGTSTVKMDFSGGYSSTLRLDRNGFGAGAAAGYRF
jgi:hypothetical protein